MALQSCYECNKEISTKAIICPQCGAPQNPVPGLIDKAKEGGGFLLNAFKNFKENRKIEKKEERDVEELLDELDEKHRRFQEEKKEESKTIHSRFRPKE